MRILLVKLFVLLSLAISAQNISGPTQVQPGEQQYYSVSFDYWDWSYSHTNWYVTGGTILWSDNFSCEVLWDNSSTTGYVEAYEDLCGQWGFLEVQIGEPQPDIYPYSQQTYYGTTAGELTVSFNFPPPGNTTYDWQRWNTNLSQWESVGVYTSTYAPGTATENQRYRCVVNVNGTVYEHLESQITIPALQPGYLYFGGEVAYNTSIGSLSVGNASGGYCLASNYTYLWEQSVEEGPWVAFGTGAAYPAGNAITGNTRIRRKVVCGDQTLYTNVLSIEPLYTSVDFENRNYVRELTINKKGVQSWQQADRLPVGDKYQTTTYLDGMGRPIQQVDREVSGCSSGSWQDVVKHFEYSLNEAKDFLAYPSTTTPGKYKQDAATAQPAFIRSYFGESSTAPAFHLTQTDESPLGRPVRQALAGEAWGGSNIATTASYDFNDVSESVHIWTLDYAPAAIPVTAPTAVYPTGVLAKVTSYDEKGSRVISYTDKDGRLVLKKVQLGMGIVGLSLQHFGWVCTYYVYDDLGQLRFTITPKAVAYLDDNSWNLTQGVVDDLCYTYRYDEKGRLVVSKQPGVGESYMVYDKKDRLVLSQNANQRLENRWSFILYDELNREVASGNMLNANTREWMQAAVNNLTNGTITNEVTINANLSKTVVANFPVADQPTSAAPPISGSTAVNFSAFTHYDDYNYGTSRTYGYRSSFSFANDPTFPAEQATKSSRVRGMVTGQWTKVLDNDYSHSNDRYMASCQYYDEAGRVLQVVSDNHKGSLTVTSSGADCQTYQYDFAGRVLSTHLSHQTAGSSAFTIITKHEFDRLGRLTRLSKSYNSSAYKTLAEYSYNELGQLKAKRLAPYDATRELEKQEFSYNLHGLLTGINKDYALSTNTYSQWDRYFSLYLGYENKDGRFADRQYNGNLTGVIWRTQGDNTPRKYDYTYDRLGRLTSAQFSQRSKPSETTWSSSEMNFSVALEYEDGNGNLKALKQMGVVAGTTGGVVIDDLRYSYRSVAGVAGLQGNQLREVQDLGTLGSNNGILGDFTDGNAGEDYTYDAAGNLVKDLNKNIQENGAGGVVYNYLNKPVKITLQNKSIIEYTYDAFGEKLTKKVTHTLTGQATTTEYLGDFVYEQGEGQPLSLQYILHEEGRVKVITPVNTNDRYLETGPGGIVLPNGKKGVFEFFVKDHLGSTRMVLTQEEQKEFYRATMESSVATTEEQLFGKVEGNGTVSGDNELRKTRYTQQPGVPSPWRDNNTDFVKLTAAEAGKQIGPNMLLKVMAGDKITTSADYYYYNNNSSGGTADPVSSVVASLINALVSPAKGSDPGKAFSGAINTSLNGSDALEQFVSVRQPSQGNTAAPKAFINVVYLDEQFRFLAPDDATPDVGTYTERVSKADDPLAAFLPRTQKVPQNGWVFVYLSNESNESVYFDNLKVTHERGRLAQESHYYPNGLKIAGISSQAAGKLDTRYGYQGEFSEAESETGWDEFYLRSYDPQIGRWTGADPYDQFASPYIGMGNDPVNYVDPNGGWTAGGWGSLIGAGIGFALPYAVEGIGKIFNKDYKIDNKGWLGGLGAFLGAGIGYGVGSAYFTSDNGNAGPFGHAMAFYSSLFGGKSDLTFAGQRNAALPNLAIGNLTLPFGKLNLPNLNFGVEFFKWESVAKTVWEEIDVQMWVNKYGKKKPFDRVMPEPETGESVNRRDRTGMTEYATAVGETKHEFQTDVKREGNTRTRFTINGENISSVQVGINGGELGYIPKFSYGVNNVRVVIKQRLMTVAPMKAYMGEVRVKITTEMEIPSIRKKLRLIKFKR